VVDPYAARLWGYRALFAALIAGLGIVRLMPLDVAPAMLPGPDAILALTLAWVMRRPAYVPAWLVVALFLPLDLLLQRPPGLGALAALAATEFLRRRQTATRSLPFLLEWALATAVLLAMVAGTQAVLALTVSVRPPLGLDILRALFSSALYPLAAAATVWIFKVRRPVPGDYDGAEARA
jgi:rod shape-determining protein MreD